MAMFSLNNVRTDDVVDLRARQGTIAVVVASVRYSRGHVSYLLGPLDPKQTGFYKITSRHAGLVSESKVKATKAQIQAAKDRAFAVKANRDEFQEKQVTERRDALDKIGGEVDWETSTDAWRKTGKRDLFMDSLKPGDVITIKGGRGSDWDATVGTVNIATGKVGIERPGWQKERMAQRAAQTENLNALDRMLMGGTHQRRVVKKEYRWIDARFVLSVNGKKVGA